MNLPLCPICHAQIDHLLYSEVVVQLGSYSLRDGLQNDSESRPGEGEFHCPSCVEVLFKGLGQAQDFLKGRLQKAND